jgi:RNA polymerase sigma-70 factor (ECF subfamily)
MHDSDVPSDQSSAALGPDPLRAETTAALIDRARAGDAAALDVLFTRHLQPLHRWAHGRLPRWARDLAETADLVQDVLLRTFTRIEEFRPEHERALAAYLRQAVLNRIRDEHRKGRSRPWTRELTDAVADRAASPFDQAAAAELIGNYHAALDRLSEKDRELIVSRLELGLTYEEIAETLAQPNGNAARSAVVRALERLAREMQDGH